ncbi:MAG: glycosyltransferase family 39 protein [Thermomicrobiales bacterium]
MTPQESTLRSSVTSIAGNAEEEASKVPASIRTIARGRIRTEHAAIALIALLSLGIGLFRIDRLGTANSYYAAAVQSMTQSWHAFLFVSFDRLGFVSVDKPPLGLWDQALLADVLGFHGWVIILPQVLALTGSVVLLFHLVNRVFGATAGLVAALALALTPISVATARNNTADSMLVFVLLLATWAVTTAIDRESAWCFTLGMALVGVGFNVKMMEAWLILPALLAAWVLSPSAKGLRSRIANRFIGLALGGVALLVVSFSWMTFVQLTPTSERPWVDSTATNNVFSLAFGYNGLSRLLPSGWTIFGLRNTGSTGPVSDVLTGGQVESGTQGIFRLLSPQLGAQIGWLLPMALFGLAVSWGIHRWWTIDDRRTSLVIWGGWLLTVATFFSVAGFFHRYYLVMLAPAIAALTGIGIATVWNAREAHPHGLWLLPVIGTITIGVQIHLLRRFPEWQHRLEPALIGGAILLALGIVALVRLRDARMGWTVPGSLTITLAIAVILLAPGTWATLTSVDAATGVPNPAAGPSAPTTAATAAKIEEIVTTAALGHSPSTRPGSSAPSQSDVTTFLVKHQGRYRYLVATRWAHDAWGMILSTGDPVMALGGFTGRDPILNPSTFAQAVANGTVRYAWGSFGHKVSGRSPRTVDEWVATNCALVSAQSISTTSSSTKVAWGATKLYDCSQATTKAPHSSAATNHASSRTPYQPSSAHRLPIAETASPAPSDAGPQSGCPAGPATPAAKTTSPCSTDEARRPANHESEHVQ